MPLSRQQLGSLLWGIADTGLRGKVEDYKAYILPLLFFKRLSDMQNLLTGRIRLPVNGAPSLGRHA